MQTERRSGAKRSSPPIHMLRETRYMSREELLRELRTQSNVTQRATQALVRGQQTRGDGS